jgi:hypothetical protein
VTRDEGSQTVYAWRSKNAKSTREEATMKPETTHEGAASRRKFLSGMAAFGAAALLPGCQTAGTDGKPYRIDVHHHIAPPAYSSALKSMMRGHARWSVQASLDDMDKNGIATALTSLINPGLRLGRKTLPVRARSPASPTNTPRSLCAIIRGASARLP